MHSSAGQTLPVSIPAAVAVSSPDSFTLSEFKHQGKEKLRSRSQGRRGSLTPEVRCDSRGQNRENEGEGAQGSGLEARRRMRTWPGPRAAPLYTLLPCFS